MIIVRIVQFVKIVQLVQLDYYGYIKFFRVFVGTWVGAFTLYPSYYQADSGLAPVRNVRRLAHNAKNTTSDYLILITSGFQLYYLIYKILIVPDTLYTLYPSV